MQVRAYHDKRALAPGPELRADGRNSVQLVLRQLMEQLRDWSPPPWSQQHAMHDSALYVGGGTLGATYSSSSKSGARSPQQCCIEEEEEEGEEEEEEEEEG